jgi:hypothetical protein
VIGLAGANGDLRLELEEVLLADTAHVHQLLDLIFEDDRLNVYAGELEVRPPAAPTTQGFEPLSGPNPDPVRTRKLVRTVQAPAPRKLGTVKDTRGRSSSLR